MFDINYRGKSNVYHITLTYHILYIYLDNELAMLNQKRAKFRKSNKVSFRKRKIIIDIFSKCLNFAFKISS
jgi:hypothetical protein